MSRPRLVPVGSSEAKLLTPRACMAHVTVEARCGKEPGGWYRWHDEPGGPPLSLCTACRKAFGCTLHEERVAARHAALERQLSMFDKP